jgi:hypothetical protein
MAACLMLFAVAGCADVPAGDPAREETAPGMKGESQSKPGSQQSIIDAAIADAVARLAVSADDIEVVSALRVTWPDGSLGCPEPDMQYTQALVPGWRILLRAGGRTLDYHAAANGHVNLCPPEQATEPMPGDPI